MSKEKFRRIALQLAMQLPEGKGEAMEAYHALGDLLHNWLFDEEDTSSRISYIDFERSKLKPVLDRSL